MAQATCSLCNFDFLMLGLVAYSASRTHRLFHYQLSREQRRKQGVVSPPEPHALVRGCIVNLELALYGDQLGDSSRADQSIASGTE